jgi:flagellar motor switch/type III secretory pathway protein FliN
MDTSAMDASALDPGTIDPMDLPALDLRVLAAAAEAAPELDEHVLHASEYAFRLAAAALQRELRGTLRIATDDGATQVRGCSRWLAPEDGAVRIGLSEPVAVAFAELLFGAPPSDPTGPQATRRPVAPIELSALCVRLAAILAPICRSLASPLAPERAFVLSTAPSANDLVLLFELHLDSVTYPIVLTAPITARQHDDDADDQSRLDAAISKVPLEIVVSLPRVRLSASEITSLQLGDVIRCGHAETEPLPASVADRVLFTGHLQPGPRRVQFLVETTRIGAPS